MIYCLFYAFLYVHLLHMFVLHMCVSLNIHGFGVPEPSIISCRRWHKKVEISLLIWVILYAYLIIETEESEFYYNMKMK